MSPTLNPRTLSFSTFFSKRPPLHRGASDDEAPPAGYVRRLVRRIILDPDRLFDDAEMVEEYKSV